LKKKESKQTPSFLFVLFFVLLVFFYQTKKPKTDKEIVNVSQKQGYHYQGLVGCQWL